MLVGSLDIGIANVGFAVYDTDRATVVHLERFDVRRDGTGPRVPFSDKAAVFLVQRAVVRRRDLFAQCTVVAIEKQMQRSMIIIQYVFEALLGGLTTVVQVDPRAVKTFMGTGCRGSHARNKRAAVVALKDLLDAPGRARLATFKKQDDVADALFGALFTAARYDTLCAQKMTACAPVVPASKRRKRKRKRPSTRGTQ